MSRVYTLTEESIKLLAADHRKLAAQVENIRRQIQPVSKTPYTMPSEVVQVWHTSGSPSVGDTVSTNADGLHKGRVKRIKGQDFATSDNCWILFIDTYDTNEGNVDATQGEYYGPARANGFFDSGGELLPLYTVRKGTASELSYVEYYLNLGIEGWTSSTQLNSGSPNGWVGSQAYAGSESKVGIAYQSAETTPSTNGNYLISTTGLYRIVLSGYSKMKLNGTRTWSTTTRNTSAVANAPGTNHFHTYTENNYEDIAKGPMLTIKLYRKPSGSAMAAYTDAQGASRTWQHRFWQPNDTQNFFPISTEWNCNLNAGDKIALKFTLGETATNATFELVDGYSPFMRVERLSTTQYPWTLF